MAIILFTGGARSGKSRLAEARLAALPGQPCYIATAQAWDDEMADRIAAHRAARPDWRTIEEPLDLPAALATADGPVLIDCLTLWLSNLMAAGRDVAAATEALKASLVAAPVPVILVTNEVGSGIVPDNALARVFRDAQGRLNQGIGDIADEVWLVVAGQGLQIKGQRT
ncbi:bifunctional adenosylcobinamide kinase/adenosylcobinamide-phosphate guanylyltransferase [Paracoccus sp. p4-l81]|uniref:bifunctional adenosylcobinamide kinase/adenosylcobinamide-phosphate guanylyltransferase n=1 Tax=unclassified Paracoccus (in: a-proteobacteria) TaxID=2688777 RepID=UPI0035B80B4C